jgi:AcrR family transcriptional regulator
MEETAPGAGTTSTGPTERRRQADRSEATRASLLSVARTTFAERGFADTSTEEIVRRAGVTRGALYHHFRDKEDLFRAVFEDIEAELARRSMDAAVAHSDLREGLYAACAEFLDACLEPDVQRIALIDAPSVLGWDEWREIDARHALGLITLAVQAAIVEGIIPEQPSVPLAHMLMGALTEGAMLIARSSDTTKTRVEVGHTVERLLKGLEQTGS